MEVLVPYRVIYETERPVAASEVIKTLSANLHLVQETKDFLQDCVDGLTIYRVDLLVRDIHEGSLREVFFIALLATFGKQLEEEVPESLEHLLGIDIPEDYDSMVTVAVMVVIFYALDFVYRRVTGAIASREARAQLNGLVSDLAAKLDIPENRVRQSLALTACLNAVRRAVPT